MTFTVETGANNKAIPTLKPPPVAHVAFVRFGGLYYCVMVNAGQVTELYCDHNFALVQGFQFGYSRGTNLPRHDRVLIDLTSKCAESVVHAYAEWFIVNEK